MIRYILFHLEVMWAFARGQRAALYGIDATAQGVWLSFCALLIVEPVSFVYASLFGFLDRIFLFRDSGFVYYLLQLFLDWGLVPLVLFALSGLFAFRDKLVPLIVSYNWMSVIVMVLTLLPSALISSKLAGPQASFLIMIGMYSFVMWISYRLIHFVLGCPMGMALALTVFIMVINIGSAGLLNSIALRLPVEATEPLNGVNR